MPNKLQAYAEQAERTARQITGSHLAWTAFLTTAARLYKYPYNEQLMIYMQRPEATACAEYDFWNEKMGRYVRRGSTGIALIDATGYKPRLKYVFDVSDTGGKENARRVNLWELKDAHTDSVSAMLERNYGVSGKNGLAEQFESVASQLAAEYWRDHSRDILGIVADSYLEEYDDYNIEVAFKNAAVVSITYSLMSRCGMQPEDHFEHEDFFSIFDFNTPRTVAALGTAVSEINEQVLRQIEVTIRNYEREHSAERTAEHGEQPDLHDERRLHDSRPEDRGAGAAPRQVRADAPEVPEGASSHSLEPDDLGGNPVSAPAGDRAGGAEPLRADDAGAGGGGRSDGSAESPRPNEMGGPDEHLQGASGGSDSRGADLRITEHPARGGQLSFFPTEAEQIASIEEAESVAQTPFAFSVSQERLDLVLRLGGNEDDTRMVIAAAFQKQKSTEDIAALLQNTFHGGNGFKTPEGELSAWYAVDGIHIAPGRSAEYVRSAQVIAWQDAAARISQLMDSGAYASNVELAEAGQHERMQLAQALWYLKHDFSDEAREQGYLSCMDTLRGGGFPDETARLAEQLTNTDFRETLSGEFAQFYAAHEQDRSLLRFHYHKLENIWQSLRDLSLPRREYSSEMTAVPELGRFITEDEIDHALDRGSGVEGGKGRIYEYFTADHTGKENLPTPTAIYHTEVTQPTALQQQMVQELSERAAKVHAGSVDASTDNMLKITSDGRKLGLDQRVINPDLPDDPNSKVNLCVDNIHRIWQDGQAEKLTQLVFCDLSTPKGKAAQSGRIAAKGTDSPELHALEAAIDAETEPEEPPFTIYDDIREKLVARGIPREQIAFIHEANTEVRKKELFAKVRSGQVRVLLGSTFKMGAGMNVQDRLVALHDLDCPWRPGDLEQRSGRIIRQGNRNKKVHIYRYVTESTFDAYLWQTVENKQKFISQIMTSKSPVRSCEDIDEAALSYAEIKALCAGDERIREKMDLDVDVARLRLMKANHQSQQYRLEDNILRHFPAQIEENKGFLSGFEADMKTLEAHPHPKDGFAGMEVKGDLLTDKDNAGAAILEAFKDAKGLEPVPIGSYRGFAMSLTVENFGKDFILTLKGRMSHRVELGKDARGNLVRIDNALAQMPERYKTVQGRLENVQAQLATAKAELGKPFPQEAELKEKSARLAELNAELNIDDRTPMEQAAENVVAKRPSVLGKLKAPSVHGAGEKKKSHEQEAR